MKRKSEDDEIDQLQEPKKRRESDATDAEVSAVW